MHSNKLDAFELIQVALEICCRLYVLSYFNIRQLRKCTDSTATIIEITLRRLCSLISYMHIVHKSETYWLKGHVDTVDQQSDLHYSVCPLIIYTKSTKKRLCLRFRVKASLSNMYDLLMDSI